MGRLGLPKRNDHYKQGVFYPKNKDKLLGKSDFAIYRSGLELKYFKILDNNPNVINWGSEEIYVPYYFNNDWHRYYIDLVVIFKVGDKTKKFLIELKPYRQTIQPEKTKRKREKTFVTESYTYAKNIAKWKAASEYAKRKGVEFKVLTEKDLG